MTAAELEALRLLGQYTAGRYTILDLAGPRKVHCRIEIMSTLTGVKTPQSKAGVNALRDALYTLFPPLTGSCRAVREDAFIELCRKCVFAADLGRVHP